MFKILKKLFKCKHEGEMIYKSNILQQDEMGYPLRLFSFQCTKCGEIKRNWIDVPVEELKEIETGKSMLLRRGEISVFKVDKKN